MAEWVLAYLDAARVERAVVVGWSLGGAVVASLSGHHPSRVSGLVLEAPAMLEFSFPIALMPLKLAGIGETMHLIAANRLLRRFVMASTFARGFAAAEDTLERYWRGWRVKGRGRYVRELLRTYESTETTPLLRDLRAPTWVVHGDDDQLVPIRVADEIGALIPGSHVSKLTKVGHAPHVEAPEAVLDVIRAALARVGAG
jgi:pimeloyl-ACP methyl ester carboxylesterase